jgi:hypothetical protein
MIRRLIIRPEAEAEMAEAFDWYEERLSGLGASFLLCVAPCSDAPVSLRGVLCGGQGACCRSVRVSRQTESEELAGESLKWRQKYEPKFTEQ